MTKTALKSKNFDIPEKNVSRMSLSHVNETTDELVSPFNEIKNLDMVRKLDRNNSQVKGWLKTDFSEHHRYWPKA